MNSNSLNIALVISTLSGGGAERVLSDMANYWSRCGHKVTLITLSKAVPDFSYFISPKISRLELSAPISSQNILSKTFSNLLLLKRLRLAFKDLEPDTVVSFIDTNNVLSLIASLGLKHKLIVSERVNPSANYMLNNYWRFLRFVMYKFAEHLVVQTSDVKAIFSKSTKSEISVIPNSLRHLPLPKSKRKKIILAVGRLANQKGFDLLLHAFGRLHKKYPEWKIVILGEGPERIKLENLVRTLELRDNVKLVGQVSNVEKWMETASIQIQPSRFEGFPNVLIEGMAMGLAVVSTDCPSGPADIIKNQENGILVPTEDIISLVTAMERLINDEHMRRKISTAAMNVRQTYELQKIMKQWDCLIQS